jgi:hypothetical protein
LRQIGYSPECSMHGKIFWELKLIVTILNQGLLKKLGFFSQKLAGMKWKEQFLFGKKSLDTKVTSSRNILIY